MYDHVRPDAIALMAATLMLKRAANIGFGTAPSSRLISITLASESFARLQRSPRFAVPCAILSALFSFGLAQRRWLGLMHPRCPFPQECAVSGFPSGGGPCAALQTSRWAEFLLTFGYPFFGIPNGQNMQSCVVAFATSAIKTSAFPFGVLPPVGLPCIRHRK